MQQSLPAGTVLKGKYKITRLVGGGGMAWVYQVDRLSDHSVWALKELRPQSDDPQEQALALRLFQQEAIILSRLEHRNLPKVIDFFEEGKDSLLVMEFIWGQSLEKRLKAANAPLLESEVLRWAIQLCEVLDYLHNQNPPIIFRDLKPSNVMVTNEGLIKLIDFGIARTYKVGKKRDTVAMGSENYAAPEQWGKGQTDGRSDVYSLGATMYHLLANVPPTPAFLPSPPLPLRTYNAALSKKTLKLVAKAMEREREKRYRAAQEMRQVLLDCLPEPYVEPRAAVEPAPPPPPKRCPNCGCENRAGARFCVGCGASFVGLLPAVLRVIQPVRAAWEMPIRRTPLLIGRASEPEDFYPDLDLSFYDPSGYVSRRHAQVTKGSDGYLITDLGSNNGTTVNNVKLATQQPHPLRNGDRVKIGKVVLQLQLYGAHST
jgi:serine/threonine protein kinase